MTTTNEPAAAADSRCSTALEDRKPAWDMGVTIDTLFESACIAYLLVEDTLGRGENAVCDMVRKSAPILDGYRIFIFTEEQEVALYRSVSNLIDAVTAARKQFHAGTSESPGANSASR